MRKFITLLLTLPLLMVFACDSEEEAANPSENAVQQTTAKPPEKLPSYPTQAVTIEDINQPIRLTGRVVPLQEAIISSQVPGLVLPTTKLLQKGKYYTKGETVVKIDDEQLRLGLRAERSQLKSALVRLLSELSIDYPAEYSAWKQFTDDISPEKNLPELPTIEAEQLTYFINAKGIPAQYYGIQTQEALLGDYVVRAPFSGRLTMAQVDPGAYVQPGAPLAKISRTDVYEVEAAVPARAIYRVKPGQSLQLTSRNLGKQYRGKVHRFGTEVDPGTQSVIAYVRVSGPDLRSGMYLETELPGETLERVAVLPKEVLTRDNAVLVITPEEVIRSQPVEVVLVESDKVYLRGLKAGDKVITRRLNETVTGTRAEYASR